MGTSHPEGKDWILEKVKPITGVKSILDIGAGEGTYYNLFKPLFPKAMFIGIEAWPPYAKKFNLAKKYDLLMLEDIRKCPIVWGCDIVVFGDVLEHMCRSQAIALYAQYREVSRYIVISLPIIHYEQGEVNNNHYEVHVVPDWTHEDVLKSFPGITTFFQGKKKGCYIART